MPDVTPEQITNWRSIADLDARAGAPVGNALREAANEVERLGSELSLAFGPGMYLDIQKVLDEALGTTEADGAAAGIVADVALLADQKRAAEAEVERLKAEATVQANALGELLDAVRAVETENGELHVTVKGFVADLAAVEAERDKLAAARAIAREDLIDAISLCKVEGVQPIEGRVTISAESLADAILAALDQPKDDGGQP